MGQDQSPIGYALTLTLALGSHNLFVVGLLGFVGVCFALYLFPRLARPQWSYEAVLLGLAQILVLAALYQCWWAVPHTEQRHILVPIPFRRSPPFHMWALFSSAYWCAYWVLRWIEYRGARLLLPTVCLISGVGWAMVLRLDSSLGQRQVWWIAAGLMVYTATCILLRDYRLLWKGRWWFLGLALALQLGLLFWGVERNGARLWYQVQGFTVQPVEVVKVLLLIFIASCLLPFVEHGPEEGGKPIRRRTLGLFALCWGGAELILAYQRDLGMALLLFGVFLGLFFVATGRSRWVAFILLVAALGAFLGYHKFAHVRVRFEAWLDPWPHVQQSAYQLTQGLFAVSSGGWWGRGWGQGLPDFVPEVATDFIFVALVEEIGILGGLAVVAVTILLTLVALSAAIRCRDPFARLLIVGLATLEAWQTVIVLFGILRLAPMTGLTLPFVSYGGSSLVANFLALGIIQRLTQPDCQSSEVSMESGSALRLRVLRGFLVGLLLVAAVQLLNLHWYWGDFLRGHQANPRAVQAQVRAVSE